MGRTYPQRCAKQGLSAWLVLPALLSCSIAVAGPADYIYLPAVQPGERELDIKYGNATPVAGNSMQAGSIGLGYGVNERWFSELYIKHERIGASGATLAEWENKLQLTEIGQYLVDLGLVTEFEAPLSGNAPREVRLGTLLQSELGRMQLNGNLLFARAFGATDESGLPYTTNLLYQWQAKYISQQPLGLGIQGFGELGKWNNWNPSDRQNHRMGPAVMGKFPLAGGQVVKFNAAWLFGVSQAAPGHTFRMQMEYEF